MDQVWILGSRREEGAEVTIESSLECSTTTPRWDGRCSDAGPWALPLMLCGISHFLLLPGSPQATVL